MQLSFVGEREVGHAEFFALIHERGAAMQVQHGGEHLGRAPAVGAVVAEARHDTRLVVIAPVEAVPAGVGEPRLPPSERRLQITQWQRPHVEPSTRTVIDADVLELEDHVDLAARRVRVANRLVDRDTGHLADPDQLVAGPGDRAGHLAAHLVQEFVDARPVDEVRHAVAVDRAVGDHAIGEGGILRDEVDDVEAKSVDTPVDPPPHHVVHGRPDVGVLPVEIGLLAGEQVEVVLAARLVELPRRAAEDGAPVVGFGARVAAAHARTWWPPPVPVASMRAGGRPRLDEPGVLVGSVVDDDVGDQSQAAPVDLGDELVELLDRAEQGVDGPVVADVVAGVVLR